MMFERFSTDARTVVVHSQEHARRLGHRYIGTEHLLLALAHSGQPAGEVLREHGVTPERVEQELVQRAGLGAGAGLFADLDSGALAAIGIDLDAVRARIETAFGPDALTRASQAAQGARRSPSRWRRRRARRLVPAGMPPAPGGLYQAENLPTGHIPFTPGAKKTLECTVREAAAAQAGQIGTEHIALGLLRVNNGLVPPILAAIGTSGPVLRAAILGRCRKAS
ncbi:MAG: Clp protease N-terminal domain-containing protein [Gemmatimonadota bacterium]